MSESDPVKCRECGSELPRGLPPGLCPICALREKTETLPVSTVNVRPGDHIGRYKLLQQIGEGGCGVVFMAEQSEPIRRKVALKVVKLGMDTRSVIARFEAERQALALMDHPNIARVFDAGATDTGRPYFVMELVRGVRITDYCDQQKLTTRTRLDLFMQVCHAIQHAHQKGIVHRDIKPSNILVTLHDGVPVPKVIDFGIAKATSDQRLTDKTLFTAFEQFMGTPAYMSPEQAEMSGLDIDTRSDIYSLGVLLYELLTGKTPFDAKELLAAGLDKMRRTIREEEPARPSNCLDTMLDTDRTEIARHRQIEPDKLATLLRGNLDWIVMKALEKDRTRRYESAVGLAQDVARHLCNEPVVARPPTAAYRLSLMFRRNRLAFMSGAAIVSALLITSVISTWMFLRERTARQVAAQERGRADEKAAVLQTITDLLTGNLLGPATENTPFDVNFKPVPGESLLDGLARADASIGNKFKEQPLFEAKIRQAIGDAYSSPNVNRPLLAIPQYERAISLRRAAAGPSDESTLHSMQNLALALKQSGRMAETIALNTEVMKLVRAKHGTNSEESVVFMLALADTYERDGQITEAIAHYEQIIALIQPPQPGIWAISNQRLALLYEKQKQFVKAEERLRESVRMREEKSGSDSIQAAAALTDLGVFLLEQKGYTNAEEILRKNLRIREEEQPDVWSTSNARSLLGASLLGQSRFADAEKLLLEGYSGLRQHEDQVPRDRKDRITKALERLIDLYNAWDKPAKAAEWKASFEALKKSAAGKNSVPNE